MFKFFRKTLDFITIKFVWHYFVFFRFPALFLISLTMAMPKEKCLGNRKNLKYCPYTILIIIKSIIKDIVSLLFYINIQLSGTRPLKPHEPTPFLILVGAITILVGF